jgi:predicted acylesterase/phospholipase RssA
MLAALDEAGVVPDLVIGTSVGALNGAWRRAAHAMALHAVSFVNHQRMSRDVEQYEAPP